MSVELHEQAGGRVMLIKLSGKLTKEDYEHFIPEAERLIKQHGKLRVLVQLEQFHGWTAGALWQDIKFNLKHFRDIERLAFVGEKKWEHGMAVFCKPFTTATIRYFDRSAADEAEAWVHADQPASAGTTSGSTSRNRPGVPVDRPTSREIAAPREK